jgi:hypothetical protein
VVGYAKRSDWHLRRILAALPESGEFASHAARWFYLLTLLSLKMEYLLLRLFAREEGEPMWARNLGPRLERARALLPPNVFHSFLAWDATRLLGMLARAVSTVFGASARPPARVGCEGSPIALAKAGRLAASRAVLMGEPLPTRVPPSAQVAAELQRLNSKPEGRRDTLEDWLGACGSLEARVVALPADRRVTADELLSAARTFRTSSAPGPDGVSGGLLKFWACHFPHLTSGVLWRQFLLLRDSVDPLVAATVMDATVGGIPKPNGKIRPIVVAQTMTRCILARLVRRSRRDIRELLERKGQYCQSGVFPCIARLLEGIAWCVRSDAPWCLTSVDEENAFNSASQAALAGAAMELAGVAPELAACALRSQCAVRAGDGDELDGAQEMVLRGAYPPRDCSRPTIERYAPGAAPRAPPTCPPFSARSWLVSTRRPRDGPAA